MKARNYYLRHQWIIILILLLPAGSMATVTEVTLFPNSAKISETEKINPRCDNEKCRAVIHLPPQADPESLVVSLAPERRVQIEDSQARPVQVQDEKRIAELRRQIESLQEQKKVKQAKLQALEAQIQFWQAQVKARTKTIADSLKLADAIGKNVQKSTQDKFVVETELEKTDKNIKILQEELTQATGKKETAWEVTLTLSGAGLNEIFLSYTYSLAGCGWLPLYRLEAMPKAKSVSFSWEAEVWQSSGKDWKQARLNLATLQPIIDVEPPEMPDWIIRPCALYKATRGKNADAAVVLQREEALAAAAPETAPVETRNTTYSVWSLGEKNITAGGKQRLPIKNESWPADFLFLARPAVNPQAFVRAQVKLDQPAEVPRGQALFLIDGALLGKRDFSFAGSETIIFFGTSPLVSVTSTTLADQSGRKTIFQDKQTRNWQWLIEAKNASDADIKLRIEEPVPQARDERIKLNFRQNPEPAEKDHVQFVWLLDVPAGQKKTIQNNIELEAPGDMNLDFGWR